MAIKFQTNIPQRLAFPFGDFKEVEGQYGLQYMYSVDLDGDRAAREKLYASEALHILLQSVYPDDAMRGQLLDICKREGDKGRNYWDVECDGVLVASSLEAIAPAPAPAPARPAAAPRPAAPKPTATPAVPATAPVRPTPPPEAAPAAPGALPHPITKPSYTNLLHLLNTCATDSVAIWADLLGPNVAEPAVIQATAATLFIQACHNNIILPTGIPRKPTAPPRPAPRAVEPPPYEKSEAPPEGWPDRNVDGNEPPF